MTDWAQRWEDGNTGWHGSQVNENLQKHANHVVQSNQHSTIAVPLCGKSLDMLWLRDQGATVVGIELVCKPIQDFFAQNNLQPEQHDNIYSSNNLHLIESDILLVDQATLSKIGISNLDAIYDRAALVAMPPELKSQYAEHCLSLLKPKGIILLIGYNSNLQAHQGPPFPIKEGSVEQWYQKASAIQVLEHSIEEFDSDSPMAQRGMQWIETTIWKITK